MNLPPFDGNDYRKRVLAAVDKRGLELSDPFEVYDLPLETAGALPDQVVAARVDEVWAFWQKQRDHPKYRGLVTALLAVHPHLAEQLRSPAGRRLLADEVRLARVRRDEEQYRELDAALDRLVERFGHIPDDKVEGLRRFAHDHGLDDSAFEQRLALRPRPSPAPGSPDDAARADDRVLLEQVRFDLDELGQLDGVRIPSLHALLDLPPTAAREAVRRRRDVLAALNRERRPDRRRALVDDLLVAVSRLLVDGDADRYLDHLQAEVVEQLRPRIAAAVLVEDDLTADDAAYLVGEAVAAGLDPGRAATVVNGLASELGVVSTPAVPPAAGGPPGERRTPPQQTGAAGWADRVKRGRAALRAGLLREARTHVTAARDTADGMYPPIRALQDDVAAAEARAGDAWRRAEEALAERRYTAAAVELEVLAGSARDTHGPRGDAPGDLLVRVRAELARADDRCRAADGLHGAERELALLAVLDAVADHEAARRELGVVGLAPASEVAVAHVQGGGRRITWRPSLSPGPVDYRVLRVTPDGGRRMVGRTRTTSLEDGAQDEVAGYVVIATRAGVSAPEASGSATPPGPRPHGETPSRPSPVAGVPVIESLAVTPHGRRVRLVFHPPAAELTAEVRRLPIGALPPTPGSVVDPDQLGTPVPSMAPGLAVDSRPSATVTHYVVLTRAAATAVAGASAAFVAAPPVTGAELVDGRLRWAWPAGCTEAVVVFGRNRPPSGPAEPETVQRRITNARYEIDGGVAVPDGHQHAAVFTCLRAGGRLHVSSEAPPGARARLA